MPQFTNFGTIKAGPAAPAVPGSEVISTINVPFNNDGTVEAQSGTELRLRQGGVHAGEFLADAGSIIAFDMAFTAPTNTTNKLITGTFFKGSGFTLTASLQGTGLYEVDDAATLEVDAGVTIGVTNFLLEQNGNPGPNRFRSHFKTPSPGICLRKPQGKQVYICSDGGF